MAPHKQPTKEELEEQTRLAIEEAEKLKDIPEPEEGEEEPEIQEEETGQAEPSEEEKERLKNKLSASARENQKIYAKNRVINKALTEIDDIPEPTEEELTKQFSDWDLMSEVEKTLAKETVVSKNWRSKLKEASDQATKIEKWTESVEEYADDPKTLIDHPELEGKTEAFLDFAAKESNNSVPFPLLVSAFLYERLREVKPNKGSMFETGTGGPNDKPAPKSDKITLEDARRIRESDYARYRELLKAGKIESNF